MTTGVALLRGLHVASVLSLFGILVFLIFVVPHATEDGTTQTSILRLRLLRLARLSAICALVSAMAWLIAETAVMAGADSARMTLRAFPVVASRTQFGQWLLARCLLLLIMLPLFRLWRPGIVMAASFAAMGLAIQPMLGHAGAIGGGIGVTLIVSEIAHLLAAGAWLGGLLPLFIAIALLPHEAAATACRDFTPVGLSAVLVLGATAVLQVAEFMGGLPGLFGTAYGHVALVKLALFIVLLALAALNRLVLTDRLDGATQDTARRHMRVSIGAEAALGLLVVITAGFLASHTPGTHEQPVWPFSWRPSGAVFFEPELRGEVVGALVACGFGIILVVVGLILRRYRIRWLVVTAGGMLSFLALPHLDLLFVPAYPTSFFTSPTEFAATAIAHGAKLFVTNCAVCHGPNGQGDGPAAKSLPVQPADLTAEHFWAHTDGELFWYLTHGFEASDGSLTMPGFSGTLSSEARWDLIDYLHAHNAGDSMRRTGQWPHPLPVPQFDAECADDRTIDLDDLRGRALRIVAEAAEGQPPPASPPDLDVVTIVVALDPAIKPDQATCITREPAAWTAFAIIAGVRPDAFAGTQMLADRNHWLRAIWRASEGAGPQSFTHELRDIVAHPLPVDSGGGHGHRH